MENNKVSRKYVFTDENWGAIEEVIASSHDQAVERAKSPRVSYQTDFYSEKIEIKPINEKEEPSDSPSAATTKKL